MRFTRMMVAVVIALLGVGGGAGLSAQGGVQAKPAPPAASGYRLPPKAIVDILDARPLPAVMVSPSRDQVALLERPAMPGIADLSQPMLRLAGTRINPQTNGPQRSQGIVGITLKSVADGKDLSVNVPAEPRIDPLGFSPSGRRLAFTHTKANGIELWVADTLDGQARPVSVASLNATMGAPCWWVDDDTLLCQFVVASRGAAPQPPDVPAGPNIQENTGKPAPVATYEDLLKSAHDEALFEYYFTSQLAFVDAATGSRSPVGRPAIYGDLLVSPNGEYLIVARLKAPYSRLVPAGGFPKDVEIWSRNGQVVKRIASLPAAESVPMLGVPTGPRSCQWNQQAPATAVWVEALDEGDLRNQVPKRDRLVTIAAPFAGDPAEWMRLDERFSGISWTEGGTALVNEFERGKRMRTTWAVGPGAAEPRRLWALSTEDRYKDPGSPVFVQKNGARLVQQSGDAVFLVGSGASPRGDFPFLDRYDLRTGAAERLFQAQGESYETVVALSDDAQRLITRYETSTMPPNYYVRTLATGERRALTRFADPAPQLAGVERQFLKYQRKDGVQLSATLYLPPGYKKGERLPIVMWAYPREFTDPAMAGQVTGSPYRFNIYSGPSHLFFLTQGYAVLDNPAMPIVGPGETANDTYVEQLVASAEAAIDTVVEMGVADRDRIGVGGHSYGAFMTANLLAHSRLFKAGIARSGAYNRSLTPFGFQSERRTFWDVPQVYAAMSPFWFAHAVKDPILLIHGEADNNSGTFPIQSERFYMALKGHGAPVRYVTLPNESHGYAARESVLHTLAEMIDWFERYVK
ncbi:MAG TPA: prolyl oligopeptidase family serine peptidase [Vicinamibacterales bacterium]|nr:prolyl oligopeptidase family serine peptidase [Vicinamibacterales bacterium]